MPRMRKIIFTALILCLAVLAGCARARVTTEIHPDGSWTRTDVMTGQKKAEGSMAPSIEETFVIPSGNTWKATDSAKDSDVITTFVRKIAAGGSLKGDISVREDKASEKLKMVNEVTVTRVGPHRYEYRETLRWTGDPPKDSASNPEDIAQIKALLPKNLATDANAKALANRAFALATPMMWGPGDPLLGITMLHPDLAERRLRQRIGALLLKALEQQFGNQITEPERRELARKLIDTTFNATKPAKPDPSAPSQDSGNLTPLLFVLRAPGKLISSNGEVDELSGEVYWGLFPEAAAVQPVVLTAVFEFQP